MKLLSDTSPEAQRVLDEIFRAMPAWRKWELLNDLYRFGRELHAAGVLQRRPDATPAEIVADWIAQQFGMVPARMNGEAGVDQPIEMTRFVHQVIRALNRLEIVYAVGGSLASSLHGVNRNTADADITVEPFPGKEGPFVASFGTEYDVSLDAVRRAVRERSSFNLIHTTTGFKADIFVRKEGPFARLVLDRRAPSRTPTFPDEPVEVVSAEDIILLKLEWFRLGNEVSDRQWLDVLGVLRTQSGKLDEAYLNHWAQELRVADLLVTARADLET